MNESQGIAVETGARAADASPAAPYGRLRVGLMLDSWTNRAWVARIVDQIQRSNAAEVVTVVMDQSPPPTRWQRLSAQLPVWLFAVYYRLDRWFFRRLLKIREDAFAYVDLQKQLPDVVVLKTIPQRKKFTDRFDDETLGAIRQQNLDVILRFGFRIIRGPILETARYGVWSFHHGDNREYRGTPPMFWEMYEENPLCGVTLQILTDELDGGKTIYRSLGKTNLYSLYINSSRNYWKATDSVVTLLRRIHQEGWSAITALDTYQEQIAYNKPIYRVPRTWTMLKFLARLATRASQRAVLDLFTEDQWFVAWRKRPEPMRLRPLTEGEPFRLLLPPRGYFFADPFPIEHEGRHYIVFEDFDHATRRGVLSWVELDSQGVASQPRVMLNLDCHLSYPFLLKHDGQIYMIPETRERRRIELWRAVRFPDEWVFDRVLMENSNAVDTTWFEHDGKYWILAGLGAEGALSSDELHVFCSEHPFGPWQPHRQNPVVTTTRGARPAGAVFRLGQRLIRPSQDCVKVYGHQVRFHEIEVLNGEEYRERELAVFGPEWLPGNIGTHTYNLDDKYEVIDGRRRVLRGLRLQRRHASGQ